jgi:hypothetical protein
MGYILVTDPIGKLLARKPRVHFICPVNSEYTYKNVFLRSLQANRYASLTKFIGATSAAQAFNESIVHLPPGEIAVLVHQDVYLPPYWTDRMEAIFENLRVGVAGCVGANATGFFADLYASQTEHIEYNLDKMPALVESLDELLLAFPSDTPIRLDPELGWHMYGADACVQAKKLGVDAYALRNCVVHMCSRVNYNPMLDPTFQHSLAVFIRKNPGPIRTTMVTVHENGHVTSP